VEVGQHTLTGLERQVVSGSSSVNFSGEAHISPQMFAARRKENIEVMAGARAEKTDENACSTGWEGVCRREGSVGTMRTREEDAQGSGGGL
jgi:hypothetical protein